MGNIKKYRAVIFDMDGTIMNTLDDLRDSLNFVLKKHGYAEIDVDQAKHYLGNGARHFVKCAVPGGEEDPAFDVILSEFTEHYKKNCENKTAPYKDIPELIERLSQNGYKLAIVSNKPDVAVQILKNTFFPAVDVAVGEKSGVPKKPAPDMVLAALSALGVEKQNAVYVGDSEVDILTAKNSGLECIAVSWGFRTKDELISSGANIICDDVFSLESNL